MAATGFDQGYDYWLYALAIMASKSLDPEQASRAREVLNRLLLGKYDDNQTAMATALGIKQPTLYAAVRGRKGIGGKVLAALFRIEPRAHAEIFGQMYDLPGDGVAVHVSEDIALTSGHAIDTKAMADEAVAMYAKDHGLPESAVAPLMVGIRQDPPSTLAYYRALANKMTEIRGDNFPRTKPVELEHTPRKKR